MVRFVRRTALLGTLACSCAALAAPAPAPTPAPTAPGTKGTSVRDELTGEAAQAWDSAVELYDAKDYEGARIEFLRAHRLSRNPRVLFNVGVCDKNLRRYARAVATWKRQLADSAGSVGDDERMKVETAIQTVEQFVSTVRIEVDEAEATVLIDGEEVGVTPLSDPVAVDVGRHRIVARKAGFVDQSREIHVSRESAEVVFDLEPVGAEVEVKVEGPTKATVVVDGTEMGTAPFRGELMAGRRTIEAHAPGYVTGRQTSVVEPGEPLSLTLVLAPVRKEGKLRVSASEADADIVLDGAVVGTGSWEGVISSGGHRLVVTKEGFAAYETDVSLESGQARDVDVALEREADALTWVWWTAGALGVVAGGIIAGYFVFRPAEETPVSGTLTPGIVTTSRGEAGYASWSLSWGGHF